MPRSIIFEHPTESELIKVLERNNENSPALGKLDKLALSSLLKELLIPPLVKDQETGEWVGILFLLNQKSRYESLNFQFFKERYREFFYVDRVAIFEDFKRMGYGSLIYHSLKKTLPKSSFIALEVNLKPLNQASLDFHARQGFLPVGEGEVGGKVVQYMILNT